MPLLKRSKQTRWSDEVRSREVTDMNDARSAALSVGLLSFSISSITLEMDSDMSA